MPVPSDVLSTGVPSFNSGVPGTADLVIGASLQLQEQTKPLPGLASVGELLQKGMAPSEVEESCGAEVSLVPAKANEELKPESPISKVRAKVLSFMPASYNPRSTPAGATNSRRLLKVLATCTATVGPPDLLLTSLMSPLDLYETSMAPTPGRSTTRGLPNFSS